jgi:subfamily B ATP-binding cassette protein MsbA
MILDEATSSLDSESEHLVQMALNNVMKNKTSLVIAHRLSTIQKADNILVLDKGKIIESGKHKDLMDKGGIYSNLVRMQTI